MSPSEFTISEIRHLMLLVYFLGLLSAVLIVLVAKLLAGWREDRRRSRQFRIQRRTPFGI